MIIGGMMVPLEIFPEWLQHIARILPFQSIIYLPASFFVGAHTEPLATMLIDQGLWLLFFTLILMGIYRLGVKRLNVNGG
jgi:ABC-2 type transport system permease protein